jgi:hypothetical protein
MKQKEVEDVFGGKEEFANADSMASKCLMVARWSFSAFAVEVNTDVFVLRYSSVPRRRLQWRSCILLPAADSECG